MSRRSRRNAGASATTSSWCARTNQAQRLAGDPDPGGHACLHPLPNQVIVEAALQAKGGDLADAGGRLRGGRAGRGAAGLAEARLPARWSGRDCRCSTKATTHRSRRGHRLLVGKYCRPWRRLTMALNLRARLPAALRAQVKKYFYRPFVGITLIAGQTGGRCSACDYSPTLGCAAHGAAGGASRRCRRASAAAIASICADARAVSVLRHDQRCGLA